MGSTDGAIHHCDTKSGVYFVFNSLKLFTNEKDMHHYILLSTSLFEMLLVLPLKTVKTYFDKFYTVL